ncbi:porin family protein [Mangrovimonas spongiae]|uniref:PorT family protein n=1 Tax=Mangrovimonas spongiae TaxID=2494697 RepID=A0A428JVK9_9FLAO|nr:porin family protein [Mangrovimonas spongiae]RSK38232.1 PorT family protein [Mangrovimonas spongiae]
MKKLILSAAIAVFGFTGVMAQEFSFGAKAGVNFATLNGDVEDNDMKVGFHVGGVAEIKFNDKFALQPELLFSTQGTKWEDGDLELKYNLSYINVPVMAKFFPIEGFSIEAGPQVGFLVDSKAKAEFNGESESADIDDLSTIDFGINFGLGYKMDMGLFFNGRYNLGLSNVYDGPNSDDNNISNGVIQLSVGYMF